MLGFCYCEIVLKVCQTNLFYTTHDFAQVQSSEFNTPFSPFMEPVVNVLR